MLPFGFRSFGDAICEFLYGAARGLTFSARTTIALFALLSSVRARFMWKSDVVIPLGSLINSIDLEI